MKTQGEVDLKLQADNFRNKEQQLKKTNKTVKSDMKEQEISNEDVIKNMKLVSFSSDFDCCYGNLVKIIKYYIKIIKNTNKFN